MVTSTHLREEQQGLAGDGVRPLGKTSDRITKMDVIQCISITDDAHIRAIEPSNTT